MAINFASYTRSKIDSERSFLYREHVFLPESKIIPVKTLKTNTSLRENGFLPKDGERSPRENSVGANWRTSKPADKSGTERPRFLRQTVLLSTTLCSHPPPPPFDLSIRPPSRRGDVPRLQKDFPGKSAFPLFSPRLLPARVIRPGPKSHHNQTERNEVTTTTEGRTPPSCSSCLSEGKYTRTVYSNVWKNL